MKNTIDYNKIEPFVVNKKSWDHFKNVGLPSKHDEKYKYIDFRYFNNFDLMPVQNNDADEELIRQQLLTGDNIYNLVFINGELHANFYDGNDVVVSQSDISYDSSHNLNILNHALTDKCCQIDFNTSSDKIFILNHFNFNDGSQGLNNSNISINIKENCNIKIFDRFINLNKNDALNNIVINYNLAKNAHLTHYIFQQSKDNFNVTYYNFDIGQNANHKAFIFNGNSKLSRFNFILNLNAKYANAKIKGIYFADSGQTHDHYILSNHNSSHTFSNHDIKGIINNKAKGVFYASTHVPRDCQKIEAHQLNKNLILARGGECYSRPELKIYADDVQCSHGSATGEIDEEALFYMQSRGINLEDAKKIILDGIQQELYDSLEDEIICNFIKNNFKIL